MEKIIKNSVAIKPGIWAHFWLGGYQGTQIGKLYLEQERGDGTSIYGWSKTKYTREQAEQLEIHIAESMTEAKSIIKTIFPVQPVLAKQEAVIAALTFHKNDSETEAKGLY